MARVQHRTRDYNNIFTTFSYSYRVRRSRLLLRTTRCKHVKRHYFLHGRLKNYAWTPIVVARTARLRCTFKVVLNTDVRIESTLESRIVHGRRGRLGVAVHSLLLRSINTFDDCPEINFESSSIVTRDDDGLNFPHEPFERIFYVF